MLMSMCRPAVCLATLLAVAGGALAPAAAAADDEFITVFERVHLQWDEQQEQPVEHDEYLLLDEGHTAQRTIILPERPADHNEAKRIIAMVSVEPRLIPAEDDGQPSDDGRRYYPGDPWPRLGSLSVLVPSDDEDEMREVELMRFVTGFGGPARFFQDISELSPLLHGERTLRISVGTWSSPAWDVNVRLRYMPEPPGPRRPALAEPLFNEEAVTAGQNIVRGRVVIPEGLDRPRLRILSTGHATDGAGGDEFITRTHVLRIGGVEMARWRPWDESGAPRGPRPRREAARAANPASARMSIAGRELWSSDLDRSNWRPGEVVQPLLIPLPELTPGEHEIEIEIEGIRPALPDDEENHHGYWRLSATVVADEPWPALDWPGEERQ